MASAAARARRQQRRKAPIGLLALSDDLRDRVLGLGERTPEVRVRQRIEPRMRAAPCTTHVPDRLHAARGDRHQQDVLLPARARTNGGCTFHFVHYNLGPMTVESAVRPFPYIIEGIGQGADPYRVLFAKDGSIDDWRTGRRATYRADPFDVLRDALAEPGCRHAVGYLGYDLGRHIEKLPARAVDDLDFPGLFLAFHGTATGPAMPPDAYQTPTPSRRASSNFTRDSYLAAVAKIRDYIAAGDVYQVSLSQRFHATTDASPRELYDRLRVVSPAPHSALLEFGDRAIISASPELFLQVKDRRVVTRPIKGTRPRGDDERLRAELLASEKDNAELAMIVDLERNDLGRVCEYGSVRVTEPVALETHPTVHHLVATVEGTLRRDADLVDLLRATFPGGSVTGAPKIRAMEIIDELEPTRRAAYTGAVGILRADGSASLSIAIRTLEKQGEDVWFQAGGGVVWDSDPAQEYEETLVKARAMATALGVSL